MEQVDPRTKGTSERAAFRHSRSSSEQPILYYISKGDYSFAPTIPAIGLILRQKRVLLTSLIRKLLQWELHLPFLLPK